MEVRDLKRLCGRTAGVFFAVTMIASLRSEELSLLSTYPLLMFVGVGLSVNNRPDYQIIPWRTVTLRIGVACTILAAWILALWTTGGSIPRPQPLLLFILLPFLAIACWNHRTSRHQPPQVFINYARVDIDAVQPLSQRLRTDGIVPWLDVECIPPGTDWEYQLKKAVWRSDFFLACLTRNSIDREGVLQVEIDEALSIWNEKEVSSSYLIPVRLEECPIPEKLLRFQYVDLYKPDGVARLLQTIAKTPAVS
jgi:hypothetical protein